MVKNDESGLGRRLKVSRILAGLEQIDMAEQLQVARSTVSAWEVGRTEPSASHFARWAQLTGQSMDWLIGNPSPQGQDTDAHLSAMQPHGALAFAS